MTTVVFLDIDGVLITTRTHLAYGIKGQRDRPDPVAVRLLNRIAADAGPLVFVISSSMRIIEDRAAIEGMLRKAGFRGRIHDDWATPSLPGVRTRGQEVRAWLDRHPEVERWIAIDDDSDFPSGFPLVKTKGADGLGFDDYVTAVRLLTRQEPAEDAPAPDRAWVPFAGRFEAALGDRLVVLVTETGAERWILDRGDVALEESDGREIVRVAVGGRIRAIIDDDGSVRTPIR